MTPLTPFEGISSLNHIDREKAYKDMFKEWQWRKNLSSTEALWMLGKANQRRQEEFKDTVFESGGRVFTMEVVQKRAKRTQRPQTVAGGFSPLYHLCFRALH